MELSEKDGHLQAESNVPITVLASHWVGTAQDMPMVSERKRSNAPITILIVPLKDIRHALQADAALHKEIERQGTGA